MSLLLALQTPPPDITGSGSSSLIFTDAGTALEIFEASGSGALVFTDVGAGLEVFEATGASSIVLLDTGAGAVENTTGPEAPPNGGGWTWRDRDVQKTIRAFRRILQPTPERRPQHAPEKQTEVFAYVSESAFGLTASGRGHLHGLHVAHGISFARVVGRGQGRIEDPADDIIDLLLQLDEG
jgi:hypothetical protein